MLDYVLKALIISTTLGSGGVTAQVPSSTEVYQPKVDVVSEMESQQETKTAFYETNEEDQEIVKAKDSLELPLVAIVAKEAQMAKDETIAKEKAEEEKTLQQIEVSELNKEKGNYDYDIASYITYYTTGDSAANRNHNMQLAIDAINGEILKPGESFSYNECLLSKRSSDNDYKEAGILSDGVMTTGIGGGICQVSSTLFNAALYSDMTITARRNHSAKVGYLPPGRDATCSWGSIDFCFRNDLTVPVKIDAWMKDGTMKIRFLSDGNPEIGDVKVNVVQTEDGGYLLTRRIDGKADYTTYSKYK
ncbi:MAG: VanW family protein [Clostridiales bacterium]|nr:VanW family protein [Clostridiales bacterium]